MRRIIFVALAVLTGSARGGEWELVWSDEFSVNGRPDPAKWAHEEGFIRNHEAQYYTPKNARVEGGVLVIEARKERLTGHGKRRDTAANYTSASLTTRRKAEWTYGKIEVRAKLPTGRGTWPAIWMLGRDIDKVGWPRCGEIDVMENVGFDPDMIHVNVHTEHYNHVKKTNKGASLKLEKPYADFHVYGVEWTPKSMDFSVDGRKIFTFANEGAGASAWPFDRPHFLILNVAVGGDWAARRGSTTRSSPSGWRSITCGSTGSHRRGRALSGAVEAWKPAGWAHRRARDAGNRPGRLSHATAPLRASGLLQEGLCPPTGSDRAGSSVATPRTRSREPRKRDAPYCEKDARTIGQIDPRADRIREILDPEDIVDHVESA